jgi:hypothetical protein
VEEGASSLRERYRRAIDAARAAAPEKASV